MLELEGHKVLLAANRTEAEEVLENYEGEIHVILMDIHIPGEDPLDRFLAIKKKRSGVTIIACTGVDVPETIRNLEKEGLNGMLTKPFKISDLYSIIGEGKKSFHPDGGTRL
jgi:DNA-binding NtrC family response regulator